MKLDHIAIAVSSMEAALETFRVAWGLEPDRVERIDSDGVTEAMLPLGDAHLQLLEPTGPHSTVAKFIDRRGEGLHHIAIAVDDIDAALGRLRSSGARLIDETPRPGGGGRRVAFVHPKTSAGVLIELVERGGSGGVAADPKTRSRTYRRRRTPRP